MRTNTYDHLIGFALEHPWAITPDMLAIIAGILASRMAGEDLDVATIEAAKAMRAVDHHQVMTGGSIAVIPIHGVIAPRLNMMTEMSGGTTFDALSATLHKAVADPNVKAIVFDVDSPGGNVAGASEFARDVLTARASKPVVAQANHLMASAAYWPMASATEIVATPSSLVGSIGVYAMHDDLTEALARRGIKREVLRAGKYKAEGAGGQPLTPEARTAALTLIEGAYNRMTGDIAKGRGVTAADVRQGFGEGRVLDTDAARTAGLIDRVGTLQDTLARLAEPARAGFARGSVDPPPVATDQEPSPATSQEPRVAVFDAALIEFERRVLALTVRG
jgi:signal peptide peptidase SppA